ncbi:MAG: hypothetical protein WC319_04805 [Candidatus Paceibacterota bacterium]
MAKWINDQIKIAYPKRVESFKKKYGREPTEEEMASIRRKLWELYNKKYNEGGK